MSKYVKNLIADDLRKRLDGVDEALLVNVIGVDANKTVLLRRQLREKNINLLVVKNSLAVRATEGTPLAAVFEGLIGTAALCWGGEDFVTLVKEVVGLDKDTEFKAFQARSGIMEGEAVSRERLQEISKWPNRQEQLSILSGQILGPGANLSAQLRGPAGQLASQVKQKGEEGN
ncbi:MAG: 50S ribosomal protein L10 [Pirellulaceae bacterium]|jgi:ribosomal protein L10